MMDISNPVDTFSNTFSSEQFAPPDEAADGSPSHANHDATSPESNHANSQNSHSPPSQTQQAHAHPNPRLNPRSCVTCRKRKVRCDKIDPCTNCQKAGIECVFPQPGRAPRRTKKPQDAELLARLRRLEGVVQKWGKGVDGEELSSGEKSPDLRRDATNGSPEQQTDARRASKADGPPTCDQLQNKGRNMNSLWTGEGGNLMTPAENLDRFQQYTTFKNRESGRLVVGEGRSRYVSNSFWAGLTEEVC